MKKSLVAASVVAIAVAAGSGTWLTGNVNAAEAVQKIAGHFGGKGGPGHSQFEAAALNNADMAKLLGLTADELAAQLKSGKSLASIAGEQKVSVDDVTAQVAKALTAGLDKRLADGAITRAQYDEEKAELATKTAEIVSGTFKGKGDRRSGGDHGSRGGHGVDGDDRGEEEEEEVGDAGSSTSA